MLDINCFMKSVKYYKKRRCIRDKKRQLIFNREKKLIKQKKCAIN